MPEETAVAPETLKPLALWVEKEMQVSMQVLPIATASDRRLKRALHIDDVERAGAIAAYLPGRLIISNSFWQPTSLRAQSFIVHELVHHAQLVSGRAYPCHAAKEREAYRYQNQWLMEHGEKPAVNQEWIEKLSVCVPPKKAASDIEDID